MIMKAIINTKFLMDVTASSPLERAASILTKSDELDFAPEVTWSILDPLEGWRHAEIEILIEN